MRFSKLLLPAIFSVLFLGSKVAVGGSIADARGRRAIVTSCLAHVNTARVAAGLTPCTEQNVELREEHVADLQPLCDMFSTNLEDAVFSPFFEEYIMVAPQDSPFVDCQSAVEYWQSAGQDFKQKPPPYSADEHPYKSYRHLGFLGLYNPVKDPVLRCVHMTCKTPGYWNPQTAKRVNLKNTGDLTIIEGPSTGIEIDYASTYYLVCASVPAALKEGQPPFEDTTWEGINNALRKIAASPTP